MNSKAIENSHEKRWRWPITMSTNERSMAKITHFKEVDDARQSHWFITIKPILIRSLLCLITPHEVCILGDLLGPI